MSQQLSKERLDQVDAARLRAEQFSAITRHTPGMMLANLCNAQVLVIAFWGTPRFVAAIFWAAAMSSAAGYIYYRRRRRQASPSAIRSGGGARRELTISTSVTDERLIRTDVADTGGGLPTAIQGDPFQPFTTTKAKGMGVGLAISRTIIDAHYGRLWVEPNPGGGAIFSFILPLAEAAAGS